MDIGIKFIPKEVNNWEVTRAIASVLHSENFVPVEVEGRLLNFRVKLNDNPAGGVRNDGTGLLTLPFEDIARKFLAYVAKDPIKVKGKKLKFYRTNKTPPPGLVETLSKTPYINPDLEEERQDKLRALDTKLRVDAVQFGVFYQPKYPITDKERLTPRAFSIEWEQEYINKGSAWLRFDYDHKLIRITLGSELTEYSGYNLMVHFSSLRKVGVGYDGKPYICFDTLTPVSMELIQFHRSMTGDQQVDDRKYKQRVGSTHEGHAIVAPYSPHLRLVLYNDHYRDVIGEFIEMCGVAGLSKSMIIECNPGFTQIEAVRQGFFNAKRLHELHKNLGNFEWPIAFQLESLLHNGLLHTGDLDDLLPRVRSLIVKAKKSAEYVGELLRRYNEALRFRSVRESPMSCFDSTVEKFIPSEQSRAFRCYHVTFTPTRMLLEGPYPTQSNRVIRQYQGFEDHFIRVDFRDEDRLQYRWSREVDGTPFLVDRVGTLLKQGFYLAGRSFEFLAYSNSALREHAVWFLNPFYHTGKCKNINAASIRDSLGDFKGTKLLYQPSKYAARLAQAFTATDPSVDIHKSEWAEVPDLGDEPYLFTDGVGSISKTLGDRIWAKLCEKKYNPGNLIQPSAYQIRFLGYKGVVAVNPALDKHPDGIHMLLRPSMGKFQAREVDKEVAPLEIAQAFEKPNACYLNRPLVMLLEDVGIKKDVFEKLQNKAVADAKTIDDSISQFCSVLAAHHLGASYRLREIFGRLRDRYNMDLTSDGSKTIGLDNPFFRQIRQITMTDILRDIKHGARIPVPESYLLVGVADEGPAYLDKVGYEDLFYLREGEIYACVQLPGEQPIWLQGNVSISRSPVAHVGDVQRVRAVGKPPAGRPCLFANLKNVVVMPSKGKRSLASCLGGGDVDGDLFSVIGYDPILPVTIEAPAAYSPADTKNLGRDSTVDDICDFIIEYIHSDVLGLLSDRLLIIADQSKLGIRDPDCIRLAELCSQAVDYPKQGIPLDIDSDQLPRTLIRCKPDWHAAEVVSPRQTDYYESNKALGFLFRSIKLDDPEPIQAKDLSPPQRLSDPISIALLSSVKSYLGPSSFVEIHSPDLLKIFRRYTDELKYICSTHTLSDTPGVRLLEAEVVVGSILAKCSQKRWRNERMYRMRLHAGTLVRDVQRSFIGPDIKKSSVPEVIQSLELSWSAWDLSLRRRNEFGAQSFGLIALGTVFDCLDTLGSFISSE